MQTDHHCQPTCETKGVVHGVDPVNRELVTLIEGELAIIDVPRNCDVILRGERIKLRLILPGDRVCVTHTKGVGSLVARAIEVLPGWSKCSHSQ